MGTYVCEGKREKKRRNEPASDLCFVLLHAWGILSKHVWVCKGKAAMPVKPDVAKSRDGDRLRSLWVCCLKAGHARYACRRTRQKRGEAMALVDAKGNSTSAEQPQKCAQAQDRGSDAWPGYWPHTRGGQRIPRLVCNGHRTFVATWCSAWFSRGSIECMAPAHCAGGAKINKARAILTRAVVLVL
jgi:hypothetical protein